MSLDSSMEYYDDRIDELTDAVDDLLSIIAYMSRHVTIHPNDELIVARAEQAIGG